MPDRTTRNTEAAPAETVSRRRLFAGAAGLGALAAGAAALPLVTTGEQEAAKQPGTAPDSNGGYRLSAHVQRYYQTAKV